LLFNIYAYMNANKKSWLVVYIISFIIFSFTHWLVILFILGLAAYHLILRLELIKQKPYEVELSLFSIFFGLWAQILVCKGLFISHGLSTFSLNIPAVLLSDYFQSHSIHVVISFLGVIPLLVGLYVIYKYLFEKKRKDILLVISIIVVVAVLFLLDVILTDFSLILLGLFFCILFARGISDFKIFIKTTKWAKLLNFFVVLVIILLLVMVVPLTVYHSVFKLRAGQQSDKTIEAILWLKNNSPEDAVILTLPEEGGFVEYFSGRKCVINEDFLSFLDAEERLDDVYRMYETRFETEAIGLLNKYKVSYILFSGSAKEKFNIDRLAFADTKCFDKIYSDDVMIYTKNPGCRLRVI